MNKTPVNHCSLLENSAISPVSSVGKVCKAIWLFVLFLLLLSPEETRVRLNGEQESRRADVAERGPHTHLSPAVLLVGLVAGGPVGVATLWKWLENLDSSLCSSFSRSFFESRVGVWGAPLRFRQPQAQGSLGRGREWTLSRGKGPRPGWVRG